MPLLPLLTLWLAGCTAASRAIVDATTTASANPIWKVVTMVQNMQKKVCEEGEREKELFDEFMKYCDSKGGMSEKSIADAKEVLEEDTKFLADLHQNCEAKKENWDSSRRMREKELAALADTIKILRDDDALELFKKTLLSSASLPQATVSERALAALSAAKGKHDLRVDFLALALKGKTKSLEGEIQTAVFEKLITMSDEMVELLMKEQADDEEKKMYCEANLDKSDDKKKRLEREFPDLKNALANAKESIAMLQSEIEGLEAGIKAFDKLVAEATKQREEEHATLEEDVADLLLARDILESAKDKLNKVKYRGTLAPDAPRPPSVIAMIDKHMADLDKKNTELETSEKDAQESYEDSMKLSEKKRAFDKKAITDKKGCKVLLASQEALKDERAELEIECMQELHTDCDWLLQNYDLRKQARTSEVESLSQAKDVLMGKDYKI